MIATNSSLSRSGSRRSRKSTCQFPPSSFTRASAPPRAYCTGHQRPFSLCRTCSRRALLGLAISAPPADAPADPTRDPAMDPATIGKTGVALMARLLAPLRLDENFDSRKLACHPEPVIWKKSSGESHSQQVPEQAFLAYQVRRHGFTGTRGRRTVTVSWLSARSRSHFAPARYQPACATSKPSSVRENSGPGDAACHRSRIQASLSLSLSLSFSFSFS